MGTTTGTNALRLGNGTGNIRFHISRKYLWWNSLRCLRRNKSAIQKCKFFSTKFTNLASSWCILSSSVNKLVRLELLFFFDILFIRPVIIGHICRNCSMFELFVYPMIGLNNMLWIHSSDFIGMGNNRPWVFCINLTPLDNFAIFHFVNNSFYLQSLTNDLFLSHVGQSCICHWKAYL